MAESSNDVKACSLLPGLSLVVCYRDERMVSRLQASTILVDDGEKEQIIILSSNLNESGAVMIRQFKVN